MFKAIMTTLAITVALTGGLVLGVNQMFVDEWYAQTRAEAEKIDALKKENDELERQRPRIAELRKEVADVEVKFNQFKIHLSDENDAVKLFEELNQQVPRNALDLEQIDTTPTSPYLANKLNRSPLMIEVSSPVGGDSRTDRRFQIAHNQTELLRWCATYDRIIVVEKVFIRRDLNTNKVYMTVIGFVPVMGKNSPSPKTN